MGYPGHGAKFLRLGYKLPNARGTVRLTVKERVLLHLLEFTKYDEMLDVPAAISQDGICRASGIQVPHFSQYARPLMHEGLLRERTAHVKGGERRRKVYDLTDSGKLLAFRLRDKLKSQTVRMRDLAGVRETSIAELLEETGGRLSILDVVRLSTRDGFVDVVGLASAPSTLRVEMLKDAPGPKRFIGRQMELEAVTNEDDAPRVFVVRGVAGIGKSSFGAKVCELLRGKKNLFWHRVRAWETRQSILSDIGDFLAALRRPALKAVIESGNVAHAAQVMREDLLGTQSLLVFDDAQEATTEATQVFRLLLEAIADAPDVRALLLTRRRLAFYDRRSVVLEGLVREIDLAGFTAEEISAFLAVANLPPSFAKLGRRLSAHPLYLELIRAHRAVPDQALRDAKAFLEEEIHAELSEREKKMMKLAALYQVPVVREALFLDPSLTHDVLAALLDRSLLRLAGEDRYEVHDTVREFFSTLLTPAERAEMGRFATQHLQGFASELSAAGEVPRAIGYLSNALQLSSSAESTIALREPLGDLLEKIGDLQGALTEYREAMKLTQERSTIARFHRKAAKAFLDRREIPEASTEIEAGFEVLGDDVGEEHAWLHLLKGRLAILVEEYDVARRHGTLALEAFRALNITRGQAMAIRNLGVVEMEAPDEDDLLSRQYLEKALAMSDSLGEVEEVAEVRRGLASLIAFRFADVQRATDQIAALEQAWNASGNLRIRRSLLRTRAPVRLHFLADFAASEADSAELLALANKLHDRGTGAIAKIGIAVALRGLGRLQEARRYAQESALEFVALGNLPDAVEFMTQVAEISILEGDLEGFRSILARLDDPAISTGIKLRPSLVQVFRSVDRLVRGDWEGCETGFQEALRRTEGDAPTTVSGAPPNDHLAPFWSTSTWNTVAFYYGIVLRVIGKEHQAADYLNRAAARPRAAGAQGWLALWPGSERRFTQVLRNWAGHSHPSS